MDTSPADRYLDAVNNRDVEAMLNLLAPDAEVRFRKEYSGPAEIRAFYEDEVFPSGIVLRKILEVADGATCIAVFEGDVPTMDRPMKLVDVFSMNEDGRAASVDVYRR